MKKLRHILLLFCLFSLSACLIDKDPLETRSQTMLVEPGDIVVVSFLTDTLLVYGRNGTLKRSLYQLEVAADTINGIAWSSSTNEILLSIDGTPDRIEAFSVVTGRVRNFYNNILYFAGAPGAIAQLRDSRDIIASEGATIERFSATGIREVHTGVWPSNIIANTTQISSLSSGNWLACSTAAGVAIIPDSTTSLSAIATVTGPAGATVAQGCAELSNGNIVVSWAGASDFIYTYDSSLGNGTAIVDNVQSTFQDPRGIAIGENDEIYVADAARNRIVQLDATGEVIREFGGGVLNQPRHILVVPQFRP
jgi:hypothetical protein